MSGGATFHGSWVALVTPFRDGRIDRAALDGLLDLQLSSGTTGVVPAGTTGEAPTLDRDEFVDLVRACKERCRGRLPVLAGVGTNSTARTIENARLAAEAGADALLVVAPYYNKPTQRGLCLHYEAVAAATPLPVVLYNVPGRTGVNIAPETVARLSRVPTIAAIKEAAGSVEQVMQIRALCPLPVLSGDDSLTLAFMAAGASGVVSVAANVAPAAVAELCRRMLSGDLEGARRVHEKWAELFKVLFVESNPIPVKTALRMMGRIAGELRAPLCPLEPENEARVRSVLARLGLLA